MKKNQIKLASQILILTTGLLFTFCSPPKEVEKITFLSNVFINGEDTIPHATKKEGNAHSGKMFWQVDSANLYGIPYVFQINDSLQQKDIRVKLNGWVRTADLNNDLRYAISLEDGSGKIINWAEIDFRSHLAETNKWVNILDSVTIPGNLVNMPGLVVKTFSFNRNGKSVYDCDDVELSFYKVEKVMEK